jgi:hypothetical protein
VFVRKSLLKLTQLFDQIIQSLRFSFYLLLHLAVENLPVCQGLPRFDIGGGDVFVQTPVHFDAIQQNKKAISLLSCITLSLNTY